MKIKNIIITFISAIAILFSTSVVSFAKVVGDKIILGAAIPEKLGLSFAIPLTFLALLINDFRKLINVVVIVVSGFVATLGYNLIPFKAYVIVAALIGLLSAIILTKMTKTNE